MAGRSLSAAWVATAEGARVLGFCEHLFWSDEPGSYRYGGAVAACGLAQGHDLPATVMPFILRGVSLLGIDSVMAPQALRREAWARLARDLDLTMLERLTTEISLEDALPSAQRLMAGQVVGRLVVRIPD